MSMAKRPQKSSGPIRLDLGCGPNKKAGFLGETFDKPEILRSYGSEKTLTTFEIGLMTLSIVVGIATIISVLWK